MLENNKCKLMKDMFFEAVKVAKPENFISKEVNIIFNNKRFNNVFVSGFGKASGAMAKQLERVFPLENCSNFFGNVIVPTGYEKKCKHIEVVFGSHPVPSQNSILATKNIVEKAKTLGVNDLMIVLISGGGSSLFCMPHEDISLIQKQKITKQLLINGAPIDKMNCVRKHLSKVKGGNLASMAYPASTISLAISDVPGDSPSIIASGPTVADNSSSLDALEIIDNFNIDIPLKVRNLLLSGKSETPFSNNKKLEKSRFHLLAKPMKSLEAAAKLAKKHGFEPIILSDKLQGNSKDLAAWMSKKIKEYGEGKAIISGGETTVIVKGNGIGGRNVEFLNALCLEGNFFALAADTDGVDGMAEVAGAVITPDTVVRAKKIGLDPITILKNNNSHALFKFLGDQIITGPTYTNVNDFRVILT